MDNTKVARLIIKDLQLPYHSWYGSMFASLIKFKMSGQKGQCFICGTKKGISFWYDRTIFMCKKRTCRERRNTFEVIEDRKLTVIPDWWKSR